MRPNPILLALGLILGCGISSTYADTLYVTGRTDASGIIEEISSAGVGSVFTTTTSFSPEGLAFDSSGKLYVAEGNTIQTFTPGAVNATFASTNLSDVNGIAFDHSGNLYAANFLGNSEITKITSAGATSIFATSANGLNVPYGFAVDSSGNLYASN